MSPEDNRPEEDATPEQNLDTPEPSQEGSGVVDGSQPGEGEKTDTEEDGRKPVPFYARSILWVFIGLILGALIALLVSRCQPEENPPEPEKAPPAIKEDKPSPEERELGLLRDYNNGLEEELKRLEDLLLLDPCEIAKYLGTSPDKTPLPPQTPRDTSIPPALNGTTPPPAADLPPIDTPAPTTVGEMMEQATVFILSTTGQGTNLGTGFFVAPGIVVTNQHVIGSSSQKIMVGNESMKGMRPATLIAMTDSNNRDYAILQVPGTEGKTPVLAIGDIAKRTERISTWGYPGLIIDVDPKLQALLKGDTTSVPSVVFTEGVVSTILDNSPAFIMHTAQISQGNSGGPMIDAKGTVLGINTLIRVTSKSNAQANIALAGNDLKKFLKENGITPTEPGQ